MSKKLTKSSKGVAHHSPGRTRLKVPKKYRNSKEVHKVKSALSAVPGIKHVELNDKTGSLLVHHEHDMPIFETIADSVQTVAADLLVTLIEGEEAPALGGVQLLAAGAGLVTGVAKNLLTPDEDNNGRIRILNASTSDLKNILPLAFLGAAIYKAYETRTIWSGVAPAVLAYWAFDSYWKLNHTGYAANEVKNNGHSNN